MNSDGTESEPSEKETKELDESIKKRPRKLGVELWQKDQIQ